MSTETQPTETSAPAAAPTTTIDRAIDALTKADAPPDTPAPPAEPPPSPPKAEPAARPVEPDAAAVRAAQEKAHAAEAAKIERERREIEEARKSIEADRKAVTDAQRLARLAKDDPARFLRETGQDPVDFAKRLAERERISEAARGELEAMQAESRKTAAELDALKRSIEQQRADAAKAQRGAALSQLTEIAKAKHPAAAHYLAGDQRDDGYLDALADEIRRERGHVTLDLVSEALDLRIREATRTLLSTPWGRELAAEAAKAASPAGAPAPSGQETRAAETPRTLSRSVTDDRTSAPARETAADRMERAVNMMLGKAR